MKVRQAVLVVLAAAVTLTSVAAAGPHAAKQRVAITSKVVANTSSSGQFVLTPLQAGALKRDSGTESSVWNERVVMREGQSVEIDEGVQTLKGLRGSVTMRFRVEYVDAGNRYVSGTGTWKVVRGTGQYAHITGGGRSGTVSRDVPPSRGPWSSRAEGFLTLP